MISNSGPWNKEEQVDEIDKNLLEDKIPTDEGNDDKEPEFIGNAENVDVEVNIEEGS